MTYKDLYADLLSLGSQDASGDALSMAKNALNRAYRHVLSATGQDTMRREFTLTTASSTAQYGLSPYVHEILNIEDATNRRSLREISESDFDKTYPGTTSTGTPRSYYNLGDFGVEKQPAATGTITIVSDGASDNGKVRIIGFNGSNVYVTEQMTLNGVSVVTSTNSYSKIERVVKELSNTTTTNGNITVKDASANTLVVIPFHITSPTCQWVEFYPIPDAALTYTVRSVMSKPNLRNDGDWPDIEEDFHDVILYLAAGEVLPVFGKEGLGLRLQAQGENRLRSLLGQAPAGNQIFVFADVSMGTSALPQRPLISNIDI